MKLLAHRAALWHMERFGARFVLTKKGVTKNLDEFEADVSGTVADRLLKAYDEKVDQVEGKVLADKVSGRYVARILA